MTPLAVTVTPGHRAHRDWHGSAPAAAAAAPTRRRRAAAAAASVGPSRGRVGPALGRHIIATGNALSSLGGAAAAPTVRVTVHAFKLPAAQPRASGCRRRARPLPCQGTDRSR